MQIAKLEEILVSKQIPPPAAMMMLQVMFPTHQPLQAGVQPSQALLLAQAAIKDQKWGLPSVHWHQQLKVFNPDPTKQTRTLRWISILLQQLWNTAWDLWRYRNGVIHNSHENAQHAKLQADVCTEYAKGSAFLPTQAQHWIQIPLSQLLKKPPPFCNPGNHAHHL